MSLTSYRAAPPRVNLRGKPKLTGLEEPPNERAAFAARSPVGGPRCMSPKSVERFWDNDMHQHNRNEKIPLHPIWIESSTCVWQTWQRPTLPRLETKYHQRWSVSRPSSEWDRVQPLRHNHQVGKTHVIREAGLGIRQ